MSVFVLATHGNRESAGKLAGELGASLVYRECEIPRSAKVIRWGNSRNCCAANDFVDFAHVINSAQGIRLCVNKGTALRHLQRAGVNTPVVFLSGEEATAESGEYPEEWIKRPNRHSRGSGFEPFMLRNRTRVPAGHHFVQKVEFEKEYRIWAIVDNGRLRTLCARRVPMESRGQTGTESTRSQWGYRFVDSSDNQTLFAARVMNPLQRQRMVFAAIDCALVDGRYTLFECNTAPALDHERVLRFFSRNLAEVLSYV